MNSEHPSKEIVGTAGNALAGRKICLCITGSVAAVRSALEPGAMLAQEQGLLVRKVLIPQPREEIFNALS